jgi:pyruvate,water dikinase
MSADEDGRPLDPLHDAGPTAATWTTVNAAEALPGVATPLGWTWFFESCELGLRGAFADIGAIPKREVRVFPALDERFIAIFYGHFAGNLDMMRRMGDQMPGSSGDAVEEQYFAKARPGMAKSRSWRRIPVVAAKLPLHAWSSRARLHRLRGEVDAWWRQAVAPGSTPTVTDARQQFANAKHYWLATCRPHTVVSMIGQGLYEQVRRLCAAVDRPGLELRLLSACRDVHETRLVSDLWEVAHGTRDMTAFLSDHGFHGPAEGELSSRSWREEPAPLESLLDAYRARERPTDSNRRHQQSRADAQAELVQAAGPFARLRARLLLRLARAFIPLREEGRATFLKAYDVARCMARRIGQDLVDQGLLDDAEDVFFLTDREVLGPAPVDGRDRVAFRRARRASYLGVDLPERWTGAPELVDVVEVETSEPSPDHPTRLEAIGASPGTLEGRAVVILDPTDPGDLEPGDVLVCRTTDPSWVSLFFVAAGCVIDVGGPMSHGAIVARELDIPCVINTRDGTRRLRTGDIIRLDGTAGTVEVLTPAPV